MSIFNLSFLTDLAVSIIIGSITSFWAKGPTAFAIGLLTFLSIEMVRAKLAAESCHKDIERITNWIDSLVSNEKLAEIPLLWGFRKFARLGNKCVSVVGKKEAWDFWIECLQRTKQSYIVLSYAPPNEWWESVYINYSSLGVQQERIRAGCIIERIFCVDTPEEAENLQPTMHEQSNIDVKVGWVLKDKLLSKESSENEYKIIGSLDVAIIDNSWIHRVLLSEKREVTGASLSKSDELKQSAEILIQEARKLAVWIEKQPNIRFE